MPNDFDQDRTEAPSPRRRREARREGNVARSGDLCAAAVLVGVLLALRVLGPQILASWRQITLLLLEPDSMIHASDLGSVLPAVAAHAAVAVLPLLLVAVGLSVAANLGQFGFLFVPAKVCPRFDHLDPCSGLARIYARKGTYVTLLLNLVKLAAVALVAGTAIRAELSELLSLPGFDAGPSLAAGMAITFGIALKIAVCLLVLGVVDYGYQRWSHERQLRMTRQQLRDELRSTEGDPQVKARRRETRRLSAAPAAEGGVGGADVVLVDAARHAVALSFGSPGSATARVVASAAGVRARRMRETAQGNGVPIVESGPLAKVLFRSVDVGSEIPHQDSSAIAALIGSGEREAAVETRASLCLPRQEM